MPFTSGKKDISVKRLVGRKQKSVKSSAGSTVIITAELDINLDIPYVAGEVLKAGYLGSVGDDGLLYHASALYSDNLPANGVILKDAVANSTGYLREDRIATSLISLNLGNNERLYLRADDGTSNYSQTPLSSSSVTEDLFQIIGVPSSENEILITIDQPIRFT